jgi:hypothetical protein
MDIAQLLQQAQGGGGSDQTLSDIGSLDPSGSTPQPAPLSGLPLAGQLSGAGAGDSMSGTGGSKLSGGQAAGPGLDFFQLMAQLQQAGDQGITEGQPNLSSLFEGLGQTGMNQGALGGMGTGALGALGGFGAAGGLSQPAGGTAQRTSQSGSTAESGGLDALSLIKQALGIGMKAKGIYEQESGQSLWDQFFGPQPEGAAGGLSPAGYSLTDNPGAASGWEPQGDYTLGGAYLNDPTLQNLFTGSGLLTGSEFPDFASFFGSMPAFQQAFSTGQYDPSWASSVNPGDYSFGDFSSTLTDPTIGIDAGGGFGSSLGGYGALASSLLGALAGLTGSKELGMGAQGIGAISQLYSLAQSIAGLGAAGGLGTTAASLAPTAASGAGLLGGAGLSGLSAAAGLGFAPAALGMLGLSISDMFDTSASDFAKNTKELFSSVPGVMQQFNTAPGIYGQLGPGTSVQDAMRIYNELQGLQDTFQNTGIENLFKAGGLTTGENTTWGMGETNNYSATLPGAVQMYQSLLPAGLGIGIGRMRAADIIGRATGQKYGLDPLSYAMSFGGSPTLGQYQQFGNATNPFMEALNPALQTYYESDFYDNPQGLTDARAAVEAARAPGSLYAQIMGLQPGNYEQGLANLLAPYGGWGGAQTPAHPGPVLDFSQLLLGAQP